MQDILQCTPGDMRNPDGIALCGRHLNCRASCCGDGGHEVTSASRTAFQSSNFLAVTQELTSTLAAGQDKPSPLVSHHLKLAAIVHLSFAFSVTNTFTPFFPAFGLQLRCHHADLR